MSTDNKYDRQLRLWGARGQKRLAEATVILVGASGAGTESCKNLVLPGVGSVVVVDDVEGSKEDHKSNFFVTVNEDADRVTTRAEIVAKNLQELNPDVRVRPQHVTSVEAVNFSSLLAPYDNNHVLVIGADLNNRTISKLSEACDSLRIHLIYVQAYGLIGRVRIQLSRPYPIVDAKNGTSKIDLRLVTGFPELEKLHTPSNLDDLSDQEHGHIPYVHILIHCAKEWKEQHDSQLPSTPNQKEDFRQLIKSKARDYDNELNFQEALQNAYLGYTEQSLDMDNVSRLVTAASPDSAFHALLKALQHFVTENNGRAPIHGGIPDMTASTGLYVQLQEAYKDRAEQDVQHMRRILEEHATSVLVSEDDLQVFCKNVFVLDIMSTRTIHNELEGQCVSKDLVEDWTMATYDPYEAEPLHTPLLWYIALSACMKFEEKCGSYPGRESLELALQADAKQVEQHMHEVVGELKMDENEFIQGTLDFGQLAQEMVRYYNAELHSLASIIGGVASQEAVKVIAGQYTPINNTYVYNGIASIGGVYRF